MSTKSNKFTSEKHKVAGCFEYVDLPEFETASVLAKIDTGAFSGAIHATNMRVVLIGKSKNRILKFRLLGEQQEQATEHFQETYVRSALGQKMKRYVIQTTLKLNGVEYITKIGLSDRSKLTAPIIIGRRFLRENSILVDVNKNQELDEEGRTTL